MKIMFIAPGRSIHSNNWASAMCNKGHTVHFVTQESFTKNKYSFNQGIDSRFIVHQLPFKGKLGFIFNGLFVKRITKKINPDIIHVHQAFGYGFLGTFSNKRKAFLSVYGWEVYDLVKSKIKKRIVGYILNWYNYIGSTSECMKKQILKEFPKIKKEIFVTPFGIDSNKFYKNINMKDNKKIVIGTVKKMDKKYGIEYLIKAYAQTLSFFQKNNIEIYDKLLLKLVGPGNQTDELIQLAADLKIQNKVIFCGKIAHSDVPNALNSFDIYVAPSILDSESFGVAILEASSCCLPVIVSNVGGLPEVVENNVSGYVVESKSPDKICEKLIELISDEKLRTNMGKNGRNLVIKKYEWDKCVNLMQDIYTSIIKKEY
ncbi:MAG: glycosyltransferase family 4 protein [Bacilli bacterium]|nr:glycosyltransferase family 4 protein [Bacilli bacterium]